jgi:hypothetical protein
VVYDNGRNGDNRYDLLAIKTNIFFIGFGSYCKSRVEYLVMIPTIALVLEMFVDDFRKIYGLNCC